MEIFHGKCVICTESTLVFSGKDKQKFVELLKEHYFDVNHINDNKFLLQFKEKRSEKSICISCAYIIECYVTLRRNFQEQKSKPDKKCSICRRDSNLTNGTNQLISDALILLKNKQKKVPRLNVFCLDCCFTIISWKKMTHTISNYTQSINQVNGVRKKRHSVEVSSSEDEPEIPESPVRRSSRTSIASVKAKDSPKKNVASRVSRVSNYKKVKMDKSDRTGIGEKLTHLSTVNAELSSNDIYLTDKHALQVRSDDRMMFDKAYILCEVKHLETYKENSKRRSYSSDNDKQLLKSPTPLKKSSKIKRKMSTSKSNENKDTDNNNKKSKLDRSSDSESSVILISDNESDHQKSSVRKSSRRNKGKRTMDVSPKITKGQRTTTRTRGLQHQNLEKTKLVKNTNTCSSCPKQYKKKYRLKLHELEHEASFTPVVVVQNKENVDEIGNKLDVTSENISHQNDEIDENSESDNLNTNEEQSTQKTNTETEEKQGEAQEKVETLVKQVVNDTLSLLENEISKNIVQQVVDNTLSQIEDDLSENTEELSQQKSDQESLDTEKEIASNDKSGENNDIADADENIQDGKDLENESCTPNNKNESDQEEIESTEKSTNDKNSETEETNESTNDCHDEINENMNENTISKDTEIVAQEINENDSDNEVQTVDNQETKGENFEKQIQENANKNDDIVVLNESSNDCDKNGSSDCSLIEISNTNGDDSLKNSNTNEGKTDETNTTSLHEDDDNANDTNTDNNLQLDEEKNKDNETKNSEDTDEMNSPTKCLFLTEDSEIETNNDEISNTDPLSGQFDNLTAENKGETLSPASTDNINKSGEDEESDMEPLKISSSCNNSPIKKNDAESTIDSDKYEIVENLLHNLGA